MPGATPQPIAIQEIEVARVSDIAAIPCAFAVERIFDVVQSTERGLDLVERKAEAPFIKDYDGIAGNRPAEWADEFDLSNWGLLMALESALPVGSALIAFDTPGLDMLEARRDLAVIWDLRVRPEKRGQGIGARLIRGAESWALARDCREIRVETQNINIAACRCYARAGFHLLQANAGFYPDHPDEIQLIWTKALERAEP